MCIAAWDFKNIPKGLEKFENSGGSWKYVKRLENYQKEFEIIISKMSLNIIFLYKIVWCVEDICF